MKAAKIRFSRDGERYVVFWGDDRIGFVRRGPDGWNAVDMTMSWSRDFATRDKAGAGLLRKFKQQIAAGEI